MNADFESRVFFSLGRQVFEIIEMAIYCNLRPYLFNKKYKFRNVVRCNFVVCIVFVFFLVIDFKYNRSRYSRPKSLVVSLDSLQILMHATCLVRYSYRPNFPGRIPGATAEN